MSSDPNIKRPDQEEIDLLHLFVKLGEFIKKSFSGLIKLLGSVLIFLFQAWYYFAIGVVLTVLSAFILNVISDPYYQSDLTLRSNAIDNQQVILTMERMEEYAKSRNYDALSAELNISIEQASQIKSLGAYWFYDTERDGIFDGLDTKREYFSDESVILIDSVFAIRAEVYHADILGDLENALVQYIESNSFLKTLNNQRVSALEARMNQLEYEIEKLDSLQKREYFTPNDDLRQKEGQIVFTSETEVRMYHPSMLQLLEMKQVVELNLNVYGDVLTVLEGFDLPDDAENTIISYSKKLILLYFGIALVLALMIKFRRKIWFTEK